jgi:hypothetical protein
VIKMIVAPLGNGHIDVRDRALILIGFAGAFPHSELVARDVGEGGRRRAGTQNPATKPTKRPESEIRGLPYKLLPDLPGSGVGEHGLMSQVLGHGSAPA